MKKSRKNSARKPTRKRAPAAGADGEPLHIPRGPRKKDTGPSRRQITHKRRAVWFQTRDTWPHREAPVAKLVASRAAAARALNPAPGTQQWESVGPTNIGGRSTSVVCDPANPDRLWLGAAGGGVWKSEDGGLTWRALWHAQPVLNIGALAIDPANPAVLYAGTGEANLSADSYPGVGLYRSTNGGRTWRRLASATAKKLPRRIGVIAIDPFDSTHILVGGVSHSASDVDGMHVSRDGGMTWERVAFISTSPHRCHAIIFHPTVRGTLLATFTGAGSRGGIWRSTDSGANWTQLTSGLPSPAALGRTSLAIAPSDPRVIYALSSNSNDGVLGVFRSRNGGNSWTNVAGSHFADEGQMFYGNTIVVHPSNSRHVLCGGVDLHLTTNGGTNWRRATQWDAERGRPEYAHADHHALLMPAARPGLVYDANDGGLDVSLDGGTRWQNRSNGLATNMFYDLDVAQSDGRIFGGGAQDNGTLVTTNGTANQFWEILGGDGGWIVFDPADARHLYASWQFANLVRWRPNQQPRVVSPSQMSAAEHQSVWMAITMFDPNNSQRVFMGTTRIWRTTNDANSWQAVSPHLDGSSISAIEIAPANSQRVYVGTENGGFFRSLDGGTTWSANLAGPTLPGFSITRLETAPADANLLFATVANFGRAHVYRSNDGGLNWIDVDQGRLPDVPHHAVVLSPVDANTVFVGNDAGVFVSPDLGATWLNLTRNLPTTMIVDLVFHTAERTLSAATYGRSVWRLKL